jgi:hypothetical protein
VQSQFEEKANIKFLCKLGNSTAEMLQALQTSVCAWYNHFKSGQELLEDEPHCGDHVIPQNDIPVES